MVFSQGEIADSLREESRNKYPRYRTSSRAKKIYERPTSFAQLDEADMPLTRSFRDILEELRDKNK